MSIGQASNEQPSFIQVFPSSRTHFVQAAENATIDWVFWQTLGVGGAWMNESLTLGHIPNATHTPLKLFEDGCLQSDGSIDCYASCERQNMFTSLPTLWNCLTISALALMAPSLLPICNGFYEQVYDAIYRLGINDLDAFNGVETMKDVFACAYETCENNYPSCGVGPNSIAFGQGKRPANLTLMALELSGVCEGVQVAANGDIAGPGVLITYILQGFISLYLLATVVLLLIVKSVFDRIKEDWLRRHGGRPGFEDQHPVLNRFLNLAQYPQFVDATATLATQFQEAQSFLIIATSVAFLFAMDQPVKIGGATSLAEVVLNLSDMKSYALAGAFFLAVTQTALSWLGKQSRYNLVFATVANGFAVAVLLKTMRIDAAKLYQDLKGADKRGGNFAGDVSLRTMCSSSEKHYSEWPTMDATRNLAIFLTVFFSRFWVERGLFWVLELYAEVKKGENQSKGVSGSRSVTFVWTLLAIFVSLMALPGIVVLLLTTVTLLVPVIFSLFSLGDLIRQFNEHTGSGWIQMGSVGSEPLSWTLGQVIAVLVWVPVIAKYIYTLMFGVEEDFKVFLPKGVSAKEKLGRLEGGRFHMLKELDELEKEKGDETGDTEPLLATGVEGKEGHVRWTAGETGKTGH